MRNLSYTSSYGRKQQPLSDEQLKLIAPSVFANHASQTTSSQYSFIPTIEVVKGLKNEGWEPVWASEQRTRKESREGYQKHMIRLRHKSNMLSHDNVGDSSVELVLTNAHDGTAAYALHAGVFRKVCSNGLVVGDETFSAMKVRHVGAAVPEVIEASYKVLDEVPEIEGAVREMLDTQLNEEERRAFAKSAVRLKWENEEDQPIRSEQLLRPRRYGDDGMDLYTTYNVIQENLLRGGLRGRTKQRRFTRTREVKSINENIRLNKALWTLSKELQRLKGAA